jgi:hypothetical protein
MAAFDGATPGGLCAYCPGTPHLIMLASPLVDVDDRRRPFWQRRDNKKTDSEQASPPRPFFSTKIEFNVHSVTGRRRTREERDEKASFPARSPTVETLKRYLVVEMVALA